MAHNLVYGGSGEKVFCDSWLICKYGYHKMSVNLSSKSISIQHTAIQHTVARWGHIVILTQYLIHIWCCPLPTVTLPNCQTSAIKILNMDNSRIAYCDFHSTENSDIIVLCKVYSTSCQTSMDESLKFAHLYTYFHSVWAKYRTQVEYVVSVTRLRLSTGTVKFT